MARRLKTIARWVNQNLGKYGYRAGVRPTEYNYTVGNYGGNIVGYHGSRDGTLFECWEKTDLKDINDEPNRYRRSNLTTRFGGGVWRRIKSHNSAETYRYNGEVENFVRGLVAKVRRENPDAEVVDYEAEEFAENETFEANLIGDIENNMFFDELYNINLEQESDEGVVWVKVQKVVEGVGPKINQDAMITVLGWFGTSTEAEQDAKRELKILRERYTDGVPYNPTLSQSNRDNTSGYSVMYVSNRNRYGAMREFPRRIESFRVHGGDTIKGRHRSYYYIPTNFIGGETMNRFDEIVARRAEEFGAEYDDRGNKLCPPCLFSGKRNIVYADGLCVECIEYQEDYQRGFPDRNRAESFEAEIYDRQGNLRTVDDSFIEATIDKLQALNRLFEANRKQILATNNQDTKTRLRTERYQIQDVMARLRAFIDDPINHDGGDFMVRLGAEGYDEIQVERYVDVDINWKTDPHPHPNEDDIDEGEIFDEVEGLVEREVERGSNSGYGDTEFEIDVEDDLDGEITQARVKVEYDYDLQAESFQAKGIDTFSQPFEELNPLGAIGKLMVFAGSVIAGTAIGKKLGGQ